MAWLSSSRWMFVQYMLCFSILSSKSFRRVWDDDMGGALLSADCRAFWWGKSSTTHRSASTSTYTNWSSAYISSCIPHRKCKEMNELVFYSPLTSFFGIDHGLQYFRVALGCMAWFSASRWTLFKRACLSVFWSSYRWAWEHDIGWALKSDCRDFDEEK